MNKADDKTLKAALRNRPEEKELSLARLQNSMGKYVEFAAEVSLMTKAELLNAISRFPEVSVTFFLPEDYVSLTVLRVTNSAVIKELLDQDWFLKVDFSELHFGNPE